MRTAFQSQKHKGGFNETEIWERREKKKLDPALRVGAYCLE
jgi:hypothetical protein